MNTIPHPEIPVEERLIFALDVADVARARELVDRLGDSVRFYKIGLELFMADGFFEFLDELRERGKKIFVDLKFFDIPATVAAAVRQLSARGAHLCTIHGNQAIMEAAAAERDGHLQVLAVTALTSLDRGDLEDLGFECDVEELVLSRARRALEAGCDGVVASGMEAARLRETVGNRLLVVTPGVRPVSNQEVDDQQRVVTVAEAFRHGVDHIVVGRPIRNAENPRAAAEAIQASIRECFES